MTLMLNYQQRVNLGLLLGAQRGNVSDLRMCWGLQDRLALNDDEKAAIDYATDIDPNGNEMPRWNVPKARQFPPLEFEVSEAEILRIRRTLDEWPHFLAAVDRVWIMPLLDQLPNAPPAQAGAPMRMQ